jgi:hypothetical protein
MAFGQEGRKSIVYQLQQISDGRTCALKVFKAAFQGSYVVEIAQRIARYATLPGMAACERIALTEDVHSDLIEQYPELEYAVLMPWVADQTWHDIIYSRHPLSRDQSLALAKSTADILSRLEMEGLAHCDIAGGNVLISADHRSVELVDLEDMYGIDVPPPGDYPAGTAGYQHRTIPTSPQGQWCVEGDRFSGAVILAEILAWHDPSIREEAYGEHYFAEDEMQDDTCERYKLMLEVLDGISKEIAELFERAWSSPTLAHCATLTKWAHVIGAILTLPPPPSPPPLVVEILSPTAGATVRGVITVTATTSDDVEVAKVEFYVDDVLVRTVTGAPYRLLLDTVPLSRGPHTLKVVAYDAALNQGVSTRTIQVAPRVSTWKILAAALCLIPVLILAALLIIGQINDTLMTDDFDQATGWPVKEETASKSFYADGEYYIEILESDFLVFASSGENWADVVIDVDTRQVSGPNNNQYGVFCRYQDSDNFYEFDISGDGYYAISLRQGGEYKVLKTWTSTNAIKQGEARNHLTVICEGNRLTLQINGQFVAQVSDDSLSEGKIALVAGSFEEPNVLIAFDNLRVSKP